MQQICVVITNPQLFPAVNKACRAYEALEALREDDDASPQSFSRLEIRFIDRYKAGLAALKAWQHNRNKVASDTPGRPSNGSRTNSDPADPAIPVQIYGLGSTEPGLGN